MNIVEKEATRFFDDFFRGGKVNNLENLKSKLTTKLYDFNRDRDKLDFLKILRDNTSVALEEHKKICKGGGCRFDDERSTGLFAIDQEIDDINKYYTYEADDMDKFSAVEASDLHSKLNEIEEQLYKHGLGQEIIFNEIDSLKNHFNLGKKTWFQLLKGKVIDLTLEKTLDETIVKEIYPKLSEGFTDIVRQLK
ncbi:MAG TPA: hypothetical protein DHV26_02895 [Cytophagales bacterium]|mgnify:CR=1 FL=1|nr:hypothetical protein [Cytophagales bacterium]